MKPDIFEIARSYGNMSLIAEVQKRTGPGVPFWKAMTEACEAATGPFWNRFYPRV